MSTLNWETFSGLPGAATANFEMLCRSLIRRHYEAFGVFRAYSNQPGIEFHLRLNSKCSLGKPGRWYGWQCKWYDLPSGHNIGTARRAQIEKALRLTERDVPSMTDWVLWTKHTLTKVDQDWFNGLRTHMTLRLWTAAEVEEHLSGPAEILRSTNFGELILTPNLLLEKHAAAVAPIKMRWQPETHQVLDSELALRRALAVQGAWKDISDLSERLHDNSTSLQSDCGKLSTELKKAINEFIECATLLVESLTQANKALEFGDFDVLRQQISLQNSIDGRWELLLRKLRSGRHRAALRATNLLADFYAVTNVFRSLDAALADRIIAVVADAGCGKTELAAQLTAAEEGRSAGILLHGKDLHVGQSLDDLARRFVVNGRPMPSFEALVAALNAAGQRERRRLPIMIDGLNEAEDPRNWHDQLASALVWLKQYSNILLVCTLRSAFVEEILPTDIPCLQLPGFEHHIEEAVLRYFQVYKIDAADAELPWEFLQHPLTLRMFCEVTNLERKRVVGVEAMPGSLTGIFEKYIEQAAERIAQLAASSCKYYVSDIRTALSKIGLALWEKNARSLEITYLRQYLGDSGHSWSNSIVRALEQEGILLRNPGEQPGGGHLMIVYDALAGHIVSDAIFDKFMDKEFEKWLPEIATATSFTEKFEGSHPLSTDIFKALVGLSPSRMHRRQLWQLLDEPVRAQALQQTAWLDRIHLDQATVKQLAELIIQNPTQPNDLFDRCIVTRAARAHPLDAEFLDAAIRPMSLADRDLRWTEWIRRRNENVTNDIMRLDEKWKKSETRGKSDQLRARWVMWTLTSTIRILRDRATCALYRFGSHDPEYLFELTADALAINDPYIFERMAAACYGVGMSLWAAPEGEKLRGALPAFANILIENLFMPGSIHSTTHALITDYAAGLIALAMKISPGCVAKEKLCYVKAPFPHLTSPFLDEVDATSVEPAEVEGAIEMDFGNYTIGGIVVNRNNYDFDDKNYLAVRRKIEYRIVKLGYSEARFAPFDKVIRQGNWRSEERNEPRIDRYGKKYSWIAYFEMYGMLSGKNLVSEHKGIRPSDIDIDPSFPEPPKQWLPLLPDLFSGDTADPRIWLSKGPSPDFNHLLYIPDTGGTSDPWVLLQGDISQSNQVGRRKIATSFHGLLVENKNVQPLLEKFAGVNHPGGLDIPTAQQKHYMFAGEMPCSERFESVFENSQTSDMRDVRPAFHFFDGKKWVNGFDVEVPTKEYSWERYHSELNQGGIAEVVAPALCDKLQLSYRQGEWDLYDQNGKVATIFRRYGKYGEPCCLSLLYIRADLMAKYLRITNQELVWLIWGERHVSHKEIDEKSDDLQEIYRDYQHVFRQAKAWIPS